MPSPAVQPPRSRWPIAAVLVVLILAVPLTILVVLRSCKDASTGLIHAVVDPLKDAFRPTYNVSTTLDSTISSLKHDPKLVVLTAEITVHLTKSRESSILWGKVYLGTTTVHVRAPGNRIQFYVPLDSLSAKDFRYDPATRRLIVTVPPPVLDTDVVDVQSSPDKIEVQTDVGWASLDRYEGAFLRKQSLDDLRPAVLKEGRSELLVDRARANAGKILREQLLVPLSDKLRPGVSLDVRFRPDP